jgi:hypothetical protein
MINKWAQKKTPEALARAQQLLSDGYSYRAIAKELNVSSGAIRLWLHPDCQTSDWKRQDLRNYKYSTNSLYRIRQLLRGARAKADREGYAPCNAAPEEILLTITDYCECCNREQSECGKLCLDHWHEPPGNFRAWLCHDCNRAIGMLNDDPALLRRAANLLEQRPNECKLADSML